MNEYRMNKLNRRIKGSTFHKDSPAVIQHKKTSISNDVLAKYTKRYADKLLLQEEFYLPASLFKSFVDEQILTSIPSIKKTYLSILCKRCHNSKKHFFAMMSCTRCQKKHVYCRYCIQMGRVMECTPLYKWTGPKVSWPKHEDPCTWQGTLTHAQQHAAARMVQAVKDNQKLLIWAVTGSGKTEMMFLSITTALQAGKRICIASPRADVVRELLPRLQQAFQTIPIQGLYGGSRDNDGTAQILIATTHQLLRYQHAFDVLIIDEIDAFPFHQDPTLQFAADRARKEKSSLIYLTATPREKQRRMIANKQLDYVFVPTRFHGQRLPVPTFRHCRTLQKNLIENKLPKAFIYWLQNRQVPSRQLLIFVPTISLAKQLEQPLQLLLEQENLLPNKYPTITFVHAEDERRKEKIIAFRQRQYDVLLTTTILERGVTFPAIDVAVLDASHHVFDEAALVQISGRAGRSKEDPSGEVIFFHDGKTNSMVNAQIDIIKMNRRAKRTTIQRRI